MQTHKKKQRNPKFHQYAAIVHKTPSRSTALSLSREGLKSQSNPIISRPNSMFQVPYNPPFKKNEIGCDLVKAKKDCPETPSISSISDPFWGKSKRHRHFGPINALNDDID